MLVTHAGEVRAAVRRHRGRAAERRGHGDGGQGQHGRVRYGLIHRALRLLRHAQPVGSGARAGRLQRRACGIRSRW